MIPLQHAGTFASLYIKNKNLACVEQIHGSGFQCLAKKRVLKKEKWVERTPIVYCWSEGEISPQLIHMAFPFSGDRERGAIDTAEKWLNKPNLNSSWTRRVGSQNLVAHQDYSLNLLAFFTQKIF